MKANSSVIDSIAALLILEPVSRSMIEQLKYKSVKDVSLVCARMMYLYTTFPAHDLITCIPLHPIRKNMRGFNQAEEIAKELANLLKKPYVPCLIRIKHTTNLAKINNPQERKRLIQQQFNLNPEMSSSISQKNILLVDDVWTTGSTLEEAASVLKQHGALKVFGATFAHGV